MKDFMGNGKIAICAHRGYTKAAPENSLEAVTAAIDAGFAAVEVDVRETVDGHLVLMHDSTVDRTTTGHGLVSSFTLAKVQELTFKGGGQFQLPSLDDVLRASAGRIVVYIDMKSDRIDLIVDAVRRYDAFDWTILHDENGDKIVRAKSLDPKLNVHTIVNSRSELDRLLERVTPVMVEVSSIPEKALVDYI
ncbi:MAG TPA: glycerophosphodiester phosphodiesterase family protein, partial [Spirochaetia bacterium]|nr:glycerophosphodiester phosphodiesterase family protein [Spirochaetia bacterium]